jgi:hypothetical protein
MSKVIKNNDGVAVVEGTPAASLIKDVDKFFAAKLPERMAGESVSQPRKLDPRAINTRQPTPKDLEQMNNPPGKEPMAAEDAAALSLGLDKGAITSQTKPFATSQGTFTGTNTITKGQADAINRGLASISIPRAISTVKPKTVEPKTVEPKTVEPKTESRPDPDAILAMNLARDFKRQRSAKEGQRSQEEKDATKGKFISTLGR